MPYDPKKDFVKNKRENKGSQGGNKGYSVRVPSRSGNAGRQIHDQTIAKAAKKKLAGDDDSQHVTYERGRTGGTVRAPAWNQVSGANGTFKGEGGDAVTQRKKKFAGTKTRGGTNMKIIQKSAQKKVYGGRKGLQVT